MEGARQRKDRQMGEGRWKRGDTSGTMEGSSTEWKPRAENRGGRGHEAKAETEEGKWKGEK